MTAVKATLGQLSADFLGSIVTVSEGGATYTGALSSVHHDVGFREAHRTMVGLKSGDWSVHKSFPSDTPCAVEHPAEPEPTEACS